VKAFGWRPSAPDPRDWRLSRLGYAIGSFGRPTALSYSDKIGEIVDQFGPSCVGEGTGRAWQLRAICQGEAAELPDALLTYALARANEVGRGTPISNDGAVIRCALEAIRACGVAQRGVYRPEWIWDRPEQHWGAIQAAADRRTLEYARLYSADECRDALWSQYGIVIGGQIDQAYCDRGPGAQPWNGPNPSQIVGGHCRCIVGYGIGKFIEVNSWGEGWGDMGFTWLTDNVVSSSELWALKVTA
jgi:hypothetical protein